MNQVGKFPSLAPEEKRPRANRGFLVLVEVLGEIKVKFRVKVYFPKKSATAFLAMPFEDKYALSVFLELSLSP